MTCPRCFRPLEPQKVRSATIRGCPSCGGVFLDDAQAEIVFKRLPGGAALVTASNQAAQRSDKERPETSGAAHCPVCTREMVLCEAEGIRIDQCEPHGWWFDAHELRRIAKAEAHRERSERVTSTNARGEASSTSRSSSGSDDRPDAGDWIEAFFDALSELRWMK